MGKVIKMRKEYDFSKAQKNPDARGLKHQVTIRMDEGTAIKEPRTRSGNRRLLPDSYQSVSATLYISRYNPLNSKQ